MRRPPDRAAFSVSEAPLATQGPGKKKHKGTGASADPFVCEAEPLTTSSSRPSSWSPSSRPSSSWQPLYYLLERRGSSRPIPRWIGGSCGSTKSPAFCAASVRLIKSKAHFLIAGSATETPAFVMSSDASSNHKIDFARDFLPCSIKEVPSQVNAV